MLKKAVIILGLLFVLGFFAVTAAKISHQGSRIPAAQPSNIGAASMEPGPEPAASPEPAEIPYDLQLRRPTFPQVQDFLASDNTSELEVHGQLVNCLTYSTTFRENAMARQLWAYIVIFNWSGGPEFPNTAGWHAINAFDTPDQGMIYVEPSTEKIVSLKIGHDYSKVLCGSGKWCPLYPMIVIQIGVAR